jgi:hypothetical protein
MDPFRPWFDDPLRRTDVVTIPLFWIALLLSLLVHLGALWLFFREHPFDMKLPGLEQGEEATPITIRLAESRPNSTPSQPASQPPPPPAVAAPSRPTPPRNRVPPILSTLPGVPSNERVPMQPAPIAPPARPTPQLPQEPMEGDLSSYIAAQRQARGEAPAPLSAAEQENARRDRAIAANLAAAKTAPTYYGEPKNSGGIFSVTYIGYDDAEFTFFGWIKEIGRRAPQRIEVRTGSNANIRIAIVRKMIDIIRQYEQGDFTWKSDRMDKEVTLSARPEDQQALEDFLMRDFFEMQPPPRDRRPIQSAGRARP